MNATSIATTSNPAVSESPWVAIHRLWSESLESVRRQLRQKTLLNLANALEVLESLPLATADYAIAKARLNNAHHYARAGEWGAADFELRMIRFKA